MTDEQLLAEVFGAIRQRAARGEVVSGDVYNLEFTKMIERRVLDEPTNIRIAELSAKFAAQVAAVPSRRQRRHQSWISRGGF